MTRKQYKPVLVKDPEALPASGKYVIVVLAREYKQLYRVLQRAEQGYIPATLRKKGLNPKPLEAVLKKIENAKPLNHGK